VSIVRAAAHVHSEWSDDASWTLPEIAAAFAKRHYDVVLLCEHSRGFAASDWDAYLAACAAASTDRLLLVPGIEYNDRDNVVHVPVWGDLPFFGEQPDIAELLAKVRAEDGVSVLAHPWRKDAWRRYDPAWAPFLTAMEVWNRKYNGLAPDRRAIELARTAGLPEFAALDFHTSRQFFPLAMALQLENSGVGARVDRDAVYTALRSGSFTPMLFSSSALRFMRGPALRTLETIESARRTVAAGLRRLGRA
jgi:predicted metal-dependent phosphoesterase TrpH